MSDIQSEDNINTNRQLESPNFMDRLLHNSNIQPSREEPKNIWQKLLFSIDIFSFIPIPHSYPVSTKMSRIGSFLLIGIFLAYMIYRSCNVATNNSPRVNTYNTGILPDYSYPIPTTAIGFIHGDPLNKTLNDSSYFTISNLQLNVTAGQQNNSTNIPLLNCGELSWLGSLQNIYRNLSCLDMNRANLSGVLFASTTTFYPRFVVNLCNPKERQDCVQGQALYNMTAGGRIFLFMEQNQSINMATAKTSSDQLGKFKFFNYFMVPYVYGRVVITIQPVNYIVQPDYFTSWRTRNYLNMQIINNQYQVSNVSQYNKQNTLSVSILLSNQAKTVEIVYSTSIQHISMWGAFWGVLFSVFAIFFLAYNRKQFYRKRPDWTKFQQKVDQLSEQKELMQNYRMTNNRNDRFFSPQEQNDFKQS